MAKDIAVYMGENGETASLYDAGKIIVYRKKNSKWIVLKEKDFVLGKSPGLKELREKMAVALDFLDGCRIFVGLSISGVPYFELEKANFSVWEFQGKPVEFLDYILEKEEHRQVSEVKPEINNVQSFPIETSNGNYKFSLKKIQENNTGITSKQALLPFLRNVNFRTLVVLCNHVPPWLHAELLSGNFSGEIEKISKNETKILITRR